MHLQPATTGGAKNSDSAEGLDTIDVAAMAMRLRQFREEGEFLTVDLTTQKEALNAGGGGEERDEGEDSREPPSALELTMRLIKGAEDELPPSLLAMMRAQAESVAGGIAEESDEDEEEDKGEGVQRQDGEMVERGENEEGQSAIEWSPNSAWSPVSGSIEHDSLSSTLRAGPMVAIAEDGTQDGEDGDGDASYDGDDTRSERSESYNIYS
jgi:hypothetical protein